MSQMIKILTATMTFLGIAGAAFLIYVAKDVVANPLPEVETEREISAVEKKSSDPLDPKESSNEDAIIVPLEDIYVNLGHGTEPNKTLGMKLQIEIFDDESKEVFEKMKGPVRHIILETVREQPDNTLQSLSGKLYLKEQMVRKINEFLLSAVVRDIHYESYLIQ